MASKPALEIYLLEVSALLNPFMDQKKTPYLDNSLAVSLKNVKIVS